MDRPGTGAAIAPAFAVASQEAKSGGACLYPRPKKANLEAEPMGAGLKPGFAETGLETESAGADLELGVIDASITRVHWSMPGAVVHHEIQYSFQSPFPM